MGWILGLSFTKLANTENYCIFRVSSPETGNVNRADLLLILSLTPVRRRKDYAQGSSDVRKPQQRFCEEEQLWLLHKLFLNRGWGQHMTILKVGSGLVFHWNKDLWARPESQKSMFHDLCRKVIAVLWNILEWQAQTMAWKNCKPFWFGVGEAGKI